MNNDTKGRTPDAIISIIQGFRNVFDLLYECLTDKDFKSEIDYKELCNPHSEFT